MMKIKGKMRHSFIYRFGRVLCLPFLVRKFNLKYDKIKVPHTPYIVVANHLTNWDPLLIGMSFKKSMYYVASDHILRMGFKGKLLRFAVSPIARVKTAQETQTVITIFRRLKEKCNVCIFAEGTTSFDGETGEIPLSIGKLIKRAGVALVTYRFTGAYFSHPRWTRFTHKGKMEGRLVQVYSPEKIASMSEEEIYQVIKNDIYVNAYDDQKKEKIAFRGKNPAEYLETVLYCCPKCKQFGTLTSSNDLLFCTCGFKVRYNEYCYFESPNNKEGPPFETIMDWVKWEREEIDKLEAALAANDADNNTVIFTDINQQLFETARASHNTLIAEGNLIMYKDRLSVNGTDILFNEIIEMGIITMKTIVFATKDKIYEIHSKHPRSALKYWDMFKKIKQKTGGN
ncbi:MAG: 1-acyl-sn-glycerol-3-phosphate acyltransferase [Treponema sp.]|jgi:1-acyl-sn-glycerol-3-phosphate acyltransferase|nr:1-acyl-sn-glycerol-3-phosphate acyltransferase [Treponema sp.]